MTVYIVVDMEMDLALGMDPLYHELLDLSSYGDEDDCVVIDGVEVAYEVAWQVLDRYVEAWENAWVDTASRLGYDAITSHDPDWRSHLDQNSPENLDREDTGVSVVDLAWQHVWDECPNVQFTTEFL